MQNAECNEGPWVRGRRCAELCSVPCAFAGNGRMWTHANVTNELKAAPAGRGAIAIEQHLAGWAVGKRLCVADLRQRKYRQLACIAVSGITFYPCCELFFFNVLHFANSDFATSHLAAMKLSSKKNWNATKCTFIARTFISGSKDQIFVGPDQFT